jgi:tRNA threonylcarbamoyladenosine biosynthesis protein TsaB
MTILTIRTDKPEAEVGIYKDHKRLDYKKWQAHRELAETIHDKLEEILNKSSISMDDLEGIVVFRGPGSFTGLRIGLSVANALAYSLQIPIVATSQDNWLEFGINNLKTGQNDKIAVPEYGAPARITTPRK